MNQASGKKLRAAVIGCGQAGLAHTRAYLDNPGVDWVGVCDVNQERLAARTRRLNIPGFRTVDELLEKGRPDLVSVVVPFNSLVQPVRQCIEARVRDAIC